MNAYGKLAVRAAISGVIAGLIIGLILFVVSALVPTVHIQASLIGFWAGVAVALLTFLSGWDSGANTGA